MRRIGIATCLIFLALPVWSEPEEAYVRIGVVCDDLETECLDTTTPRSLVITLRAIKGSTLEIRKGEVDLPSSGYLPLSIDVEGRYCSDTLLNMRALSQHPDYWKKRLPPSVELSIHRIDGRTPVAVPFRVASSSAGGHGMFAGVLILESESKRRAKLRELAEWLIAVSREQLKLFGQDIDRTIDLDRYTESLDHQYQYAPPGYYEVVARYTPPADSECPEALESKPLAVSVYEVGDSFSAYRALVDAAASPGP